MKRQIRRCVFETNSSSSHSISIYNRNEIIYSDIPKNSTVVLDDTYKTGTDICDELGKLNYVVNMLATIFYEIRYGSEYTRIETFDDMINLNCFKWLAEVIKEESNTEVVYKCPKNYLGKDKTCVPFYETVDDDYYSIEEIFTNGDFDIMKDEIKFKERVKDIIYNPSVGIEDKENEY